MSDGVNPSSASRIYCIYAIVVGIVVFAACFPVLAATQSRDVFILLLVALALHYQVFVRLLTYGELLSIQGGSLILKGAHHRTPITYKFASLDVFEAGRVEGVQLVLRTPLGSKVHITVSDSFPIEQLPDSVKVLLNEHKMRFPVSKQENRFSAHFRAIAMFLTSIVLVVVPYLALVFMQDFLSVRFYYIVGILVGVALLLELFLTFFARGFFVALLALHMPNRQLLFVIRVFLFISGLFLLLTSMRNVSRGPFLDLLLGL